MFMSRYRNNSKCLFDARSFCNVIIYDIFYTGIYGFLLKAHKEISFKEEVKKIIYTVVGIMVVFHSSDTEKI